MSSRWDLSFHVGASFVGFVISLGNTTWGFATSHGDSYFQLEASLWDLLFLLGLSLVGLAIFSCELRVGELSFHL